PQDRHKCALARQAFTRMADQCAKGTSARRRAKLCERWTFPQFFARVAVTIGELFLHQPAIRTSPSLSASFLRIKGCLVFIVLGLGTDARVNGRNVWKWR